MMFIKFIKTLLESISKNTNHNIYIPSTLFIFHKAKALGGRNNMWKIKNKEAVSPVIGVILMVAITVVLAAVLYVWVSGFMTTTTGGVYAFSANPWSDAGTTIITSVISRTPTTGIKISDITWQLYNVTAGAVEAPSGAVYKDATGATILTSDYLKAGCSVTFSQPVPGSYKVRAIVGGSQVYESAAFVVAA